jgi:ribosomal protein L44E
LAADPDRGLRPTLTRTLRRHVRIDLPLHCQECARRWDDPRERWAVFFTHEEPPDAAVYCPSCTRHEFGE